MNLKAMLDDVRANLHAPVPKLRAALQTLDAIEAAHCPKAVVVEPPATNTGDADASGDGPRDEAPAGDDKPGKKKNW